MSERNTQRKQYKTTKSTSLQNNAIKMGPEFEPCAAILDVATLDNFQTRGKSKSFIIKLKI